MQAKLPDVNSAIVRHRTGALAAMSQLNYALASTELRAINSLLPEDYKVTEDTEEYYLKVRSQSRLICNKCNKLTPYEQVVFYNKSCPIEIQLLYAVERLSMWQCPECKFENPTDGTENEIEQKAKPLYTGIMPEVPKKALFGKMLGHKLSFEKWFDIALNEIENKVAKYRTDYAAQQDDDAVPFEDEDDNAG